MTKMDSEITETIPKKVVRLMDESFWSGDKDLFEEYFKHYLSLIVPKDVLKPHIVHGYWKFIVIYERYLSKKSEKRPVVYSRRNRNKLKDLLAQHDYLKAVTILLEEMVIKKDFASGFKYLMDNGYIKDTGEWLVKENPEHFTAEAVTAARHKLEKYQETQ